VAVDEDLLLEAVRVLTEAGKPAHADNVRERLGQTADDGGYWDARDVADDLEELESRGKLEFDRRIDWSGGVPTPRTRIPYILPSEQ
jgi:hypothetical protein